MTVVRTIHMVKYDRSNMVEKRKKQDVMKITVTFLYTLHLLKASTFLYSPSLFTHHHFTGITLQS